MGETLKRRLGPLPVWVWALLLVGLLAAFLTYRKKKASDAAAAAAAAQAQNTSSNLGTVPVSNLTTVAQPMPVQLGDTFVSQNVDSPTPDGNFKKPPSWWLQHSPPPNPSPAVLLNIGQAENKSAVQQAGGSVLKALSTAGLSADQVRSLAAAMKAGGGNFLTENAVRKQAGLPYYGSQGLITPPGYKSPQQPAPAGG